MSVLLALLLAAPTAPAVAPPHRDLAAAATIHVHAAGEHAFFANAYLIETATGVIAVDAPFTASEAKIFRGKLDALGKPLLGVLVTHAHPDHVNGIAALLEGQQGLVPVFATEAVSADLAAIDGPKRAFWAPIYKDDYPAKTAMPDHTVKDGQTLEIGGARLKAHDLGQGEAAAATVWVLLEKKPAAFVGDVVMNRVHPSLEGGHSAAWIAQLQAAKRLLFGIGRVYPGHGAPGDASLFEWQRAHLSAYRDAVAELARGRPRLDEAAKKELQSRMEKRLPAAPLAASVALSADAVAAELAAEAAAAPGH